MKRVLIPILFFVSPFSAMRLDTILVDGMFVTRPVHGSRARWNDVWDAVRVGNIDRVRQVLDEGFSIDDGSYGGYNQGSTLLHIASSCDHVAIAQLLLARGASICANAGDNTPFHFAKSPEMARLFLDRHVDINTPGLHGETCLHRSVRSNRYKELTKFLLMRGADVMRCSTGRTETPLHVASFHGNAEGVALLLWGAARQGTLDDLLAAKTRGEKTALDMATLRGDQGIVELLDVASADNARMVNYLRRREIGGSPRWVLGK